MQSLWVFSRFWPVLRSRRRRPAPLALDQAPTSALAAPAGQAPEAALLAGEQRQEVQALLAQLPVHYRLVIVLRYWHDQSYEEIAEMTGSSVSAVKSRLHRARQQMAVMLAEMQKATVAEHESQRRVPDNALSRGI